ncbi:hypothetical protein [Halorubrum saccharovorum]|uniref:hypothetical protein n=1 Tax=Halorubrum saccharovorum TaxID=2248 RepID=UPI001F41B347|nr:hypothetical protein [Halorubrum saccharovorum]
MYAENTDTLRRIASEPLATADLWGPIVVPLVALLALLAARQYLGRWPDLWRFRRRVLPIVDRLADGDLDEELDVVDEHVDVDLEAAADALPEKTGLPLQAREFVGTLDATPAVIREELRSMPRVYPNNIASIQFEVVDDSRVYEVGSYAYRPEASSESGSTTSDSRRRQVVRRRDCGRTTSARRYGSRRGTTPARAGTPTAAFGRSGRCSRATSGSSRATKPTMSSIEGPRHR